VEANIETMFKNILQFRMPEDLQDFGDTMERQLGELKTELGQLRGKGGQTEWTAQLCCLSRYMYHEIN
jgi:DNA recombination-dependent growth factor C